MIRQLPMDALFADFGVQDLIPQAILNTPLSYFSDKLGLDLETASDDLDHYEGAALLIDDYFPIAVKHYAGYPSGTVTLYMPSGVKGIKEITRFIRVFLENFKLTDESIAWERQMEPDL